MNILVINGSPKGEKSNSLKLTNAFLSGIQDAMGEAAVEIEKINVSALNISSCRGCFCCWNKTPGQCVIHDDMAMVLEKILRADLTIWSFPLYFFGLPGKLKTLMDRQLPLTLPFMAEGAESGGHPTRYDISGKRTVVISTCGFYTAEKNYDSVRAQFDRLCGRKGYTAIFCGEGELFRVPELKKRTDEYLSYVRNAGREYVSGGITGETEALLSELLYPRDIFERMADASWGVTREGKKEDPSFTFTEQMAALYNPASYPGKDFVFDMDYTDIGRRYQVILGKEKSLVSKELTQNPDTVIHTPFSVWQDIADGKYDGSEALMKHLYYVEGDFNLMLNWDDYFSSVGGSRKTTEAEDLNQKGTNMTFMLTAWIVFWVAAPIESFYGSLISIAACAVLPIIFFKNKKTIYDVISCAAVIVLSLLLLLGAPPRMIIPLSYLAFGILWTVTVFFKIPLTAEYSKNGYGGDRAWSNPMFIKTNRILTAVWGILYLITPVWTYFLMETEASSYIGLINSIFPAVLGIFTAWFQKWYPAKIAEGKY